MANYREAETCLHCGRALIVSTEMILCPVITKNSFRVDAQTGCDWYIPVAVREHNGGYHAKINGNADNEV
ncbi:MAG: hypothetical protein LBK13_04085 [Spirochaetales bacterium]|nr:hypothetical protein [Spirochaetales bacterium]